MFETSLIAGNPTDKQKSKAISSQARKGRFNDYPVRGSTAKQLEMGSPNLLGEDIVSSIWKHIAALLGGLVLATLAEGNGWQGQVDSSTTTNTLSAMNTVFQDCTVDSEHPNYIVATRAVYNTYYDLLTPVQRFVDESIAKGGFESLMFNGQPIVSDSHAPADHLFMLNMDHLHLFYHPKRNFSMEEWQKPINQQVKVTRVLWMGALGSSNNRLHGKMSAITT